MGARRAVCLAAVAVLGACGSGNDETEPESARPTKTGDPGPIHVHGLGINPADGALFVATHTGLFRAAEGERRAERVAGRFQDTMGFTVVGPDRFLGSGHPDLREDLPSFLGLIESRDAGKTWKSISLLGKRDFHVLEATGNRIYGFGSDMQTREATLLVSGDGGRSWDERTPPEGLLSLAIDPDDRDHIVVSGERGLYMSTDGGHGWRPVDGDSALLAWPARGRLLAASANGTVSRSADGGRTWENVGEVWGQPAAFESVSAEELYVALHDGTVRRSSDGGRTWIVRSKP